MAKSKLRGEWFWVDDWTASAAGRLPMEPRGLHRELLSQAFIRDGKLPSDPEELLMILRCRESEWARCWPKIEPFWVVKDGSMWNEEQLAVIKKGQKLSSDRAKAGRKGFEAADRDGTGKFTGKGTGNPTGNPSGKGTGKRDGQTTASLSLSGSESPSEIEEQISVSTKPHSAKAENGVVDRIFDQWVSIMEKNPKQVKFNPKRKRLVKARLAEGYTEGDIVQAIQGCKDSPHHQGENDRGQVYDSLDLICRDGGHIEMFLTEPVKKKDPWAELMEEPDGS